MSDVVACFVIASATLLLLAAVAYFFPWSNLPRTRLASLEARHEEMARAMASLEFDVKRNEDHTQAAIETLKEERTRYVQMHSGAARRS